MPKTGRQIVRAAIARIYLFLYLAFGVAVLIYGFANWQWTDPLRFTSFVVAATLGSVLKVRFPGQTGTASVSSIFVLISLANLSVSEALLIAVVCMLVQCLWRPQLRPKPVQVAFSVCVLVVAVYVTSVIFTVAQHRLPELVALAALAFTYFCVNTFPIAAIIGLTENQSIAKVWSAQRWLLPYYAVGASMGWVIGTLPHGVQWEFPIICLPLVYMVHRSNRTHLTQMERERTHMQAMNDLHLRTIEALALAIDAKDHTTHDHLQRVQLYATEIGKDLGLSEQELDALTAAAMLHDIGKLAVPESIISKPGKLTRAEFDKMKIHPVVGAEILERVEFPYPVVPIVRAHHERWDGSGYPYGLRGNEIPIGARILSAVDCLDALASDRQYRRALPLDEAMTKVASEAGTAFDPAVVRALQTRYQELEARAKAIEPPAAPPLSVDMKITRGTAPAAGFEAEAPSIRTGNPVAQARANLRRSEASTPEMPGTGVCELQWEEALIVASIRIRRIVAYDAIALCACQDDFVRVKFAAGQDRDGLEALAVRQGEGLMGWVAEVGKPILNGNPAVEPGYVQREGASALGSALALPLVNAGRVVGVVALYRRERDAFAASELVTLLDLCPALASLMLDCNPQPSDLLEMANAVRSDDADLVRG